MKRYLLLELTKCRDCPYHAHDPGDGESWHTFELCTGVEGNPTIKCYPEIPSWCPLSKEKPE
jgi:hypothetical protein